MDSCPTVTSLAYTQGCAVAVGQEFYFSQDFMTDVDGIKWKVKEMLRLGNTLQAGDLVWVTFEAMPTLLDYIEELERKIEEKTTL